MLRPFSVLVLVALVAGCASAPVEDRWAPNYAPRAMTGYECEVNEHCLDSQRCYKAFPNSTGRCVTVRYYETHDRACKSHRDCEAFEACDTVPGRRVFGTCAPRYVSASTEDDESPVPALPGSAGGRHTPTN